MRTAWRIWWSVLPVLAGCMALPVPDDRPGDEGRKNLEAIRAILSQYPAPRRSPVPRPAGVPRAETPVEPAAVPPGDPTFVERPPFLPPHAAPPARSRSSSKNLTVTIPWKPPSADTLIPSEPFHPVPPYFHPVPIAPNYPSTLRCVPDLYGGQRCR
ncbi:MAG TPA: hypothetical protein VJ805_15100 [Nitrospiraceae bacterium]|nr:hypothetical protein [Nitrospiraceae bacterium]